MSSTQEQEKPAPFVCKHTFSMALVHMCLTLAPQLELGLFLFNTLGQAGPLKVAVLLACFCHGHLEHAFALGGVLGG